MTEVEALKHFKNHEYMTDFSFQDEMSEVAIKAIQKQIPMRPDYEGNSYTDGYMVYDIFICPSCGTHYKEVDYDHYMYCPECGQCLDLTEV